MTHVDNDKLPATRPGGVTLLVTFGIILGIIAIVYFAQSADVVPAP